MGTCPAHHKISVAFWLPAPYSSCDSHSGSCRHFMSPCLKNPLIENPLTRLFCLLWNFPSLLISSYCLLALNRLRHGCVPTHLMEGDTMPSQFLVCTPVGGPYALCWLWPLGGQGAPINAGLPDDYSVSATCPPQTRAVSSRVFFLTPKHIMPFHLFIFLKSWYIRRPRMQSKANRSLDAALPSAASRSPTETASWIQIGLGLADYPPPAPP